MAGLRFIFYWISCKVWVLLWIVYEFVEQPGKAGLPLAAIIALAGKAKQRSQWPPHADLSF